MSDPLVPPFQKVGNEFLMLGTQTVADWAGSSGRRNTSTKEVAVDPRRRRSDRCRRGALRSPGRPSVARREDRRQFWVLIAAGRSSEDAAAGVGVAPALGTRWFREAGGMPPSHLSRSSKPLSGPHLSWLLSGFGVVMIGRRDQGADEGAQERLPAAPGVVDELEEAEIGGQLLLRDAPVRP